MPTSCSSAPAATTTSASRSFIAWSVTIAGCRPPLTSSRSSRRAMLSTIRMWTQEWSDIPSRSDWTWAMCHQARTSGSALSASSSASSRRLPRVGAPIRAAGVASAGLRPSSPGPAASTSASTGSVSLEVATPAILARGDAGSATSGGSERARDRVRQGCELCPATAL